MFTWTGPATSFLKPCFSTVTLYCPILSGLATYSPASFVVRVRCVPRSRSVTVTFAPVITAPLGSRTKPTIAPASFCAHRVLDKVRQTRATDMEARTDEQGCGRRKRTSMARAPRGLVPKISSSRNLAELQMRVLKFDLRCNITNDYFYFRLIAFVNYDYFEILRRLEINACRTLRIRMSIRRVRTRT